MTEDIRKVKNDNALNILNQQLNSISAENQYVTFQIGSETYGIDIMLVQEIVRYQEPTKVYNANPMIKGLTNFRGQVIPIIDMHKKFSLPEQEYDKFTVVIVFEVKNKTMGMIVDRVSDIMSFREEEIQLIDKDFEEDIKTEHIEGIAKSNAQIVLLLNANRVLSFEELDKIDKYNKIEN
ncbi:chemotaxis protein CheW [Caldisalinibacter kiritimatiensis]|uniref:Positive regulator of CheA protein activity (CheW) n=1 Tax=Caldisalinibacter kiritimatiensis TaxID=1304284 RepID=R1AQ51_9FIRM|nr:chemotaxis protein CheW [Caldisalinibacter kiritimatiensis]EOC99257.1 Positive regulator of CheA protein activity (CheW) [Caldisalinibacter kiritimatiensis]